MFKRQTRAYQSQGDVQSPFARAGQVWDERIGSARQAARNWRWMALATLGLCALLGGGLLYQTGRTRVQAYIAQIDRQGRLMGEVHLLNERYTPTAAQIAFHLAELVRDVRSRPADPVVLKQNWEQAYHFLAGDAVTAMSDYGSHAKLADPSSQGLTVSVDIQSVLQRSDESYQVRWKETHFDHGAPSSIGYWTGLFTTTIKPPATARAVFENPLGVYVTSFNWIQEFSGAN